jgi:hypothetical protein
MNKYFPKKLNKYDSAIINLESESKSEEMSKNRMMIK